MVLLAGDGLTTHPHPFGGSQTLTIEISPTGEVTADYNRAHEVSMQILTSIRGESIGYGILGCALSIARLNNSDIPLTVPQEVKFVGDLMEWADSYFDIPIKRGGLSH